jgi:membrane protein involved in colicin uptake
VHKTLTAVTGAGAGFLMNGEKGALPGAIGALAAASFADWYLPKEEIEAQMDKHPLHEVQEHIRTSTEISRMMAAVVCGLLHLSDQETEDAMRAAGTTLDNDYMASALKTVEEIKIARAKKATEELKLAQEEAAREEKAKFEQEKRAKEQAARAAALKKLAQEKKARDKQASREAAQAKTDAEAQRTSTKAGSNSAAQTQTAASTAGSSTTTQSDASAEKVIPHTMNGQTIYLQWARCVYLPLFRTTQTLTK